MWKLNFWSSTNPCSTTQLPIFDVKRFFVKERMSSFPMVAERRSISEKCLVQTQYTVTGIVAEQSLSFSEKTHCQLQTMILLPNMLFGQSQACDIAWGKLLRYSKNYTSYLLRYFKWEAMKSSKAAVCTRQGGYLHLISISILPISNF